MRYLSNALRSSLHVISSSSSSSLRVLPPTSKFSTALNRNFVFRKNYFFQVFPPSRSFSSFAKPQQKLDVEDFSNEEQIDDPGNFENFPLSSHTKRILRSKNIEKLFPIQYSTFNRVFERKNVIAKARTGTGKTLSFVLPIVERLKVEKKTLIHPRVLVLAPTRELAQQVNRDFNDIASGCGIRTTCLFGGASYTGQEKHLSAGVHVVVGTPGRLRDHIDRGTLDLSQIETLVCDEADEILKVGFAKEVDYIIDCIPRKSQILLFSATVPTWVQEIARNKMGDYETVDLIGEQVNKASELIEHFVMYAPTSVDKTIANLAKKYAPTSRTIVFADRKIEASKIANSPHLSGRAEAIHGDITQFQRNRTLQGFREKQFNILVATDVAARGLDIPDVDLVIMLHPPNFSESYIHRCGRTGRAGKSGKSIILYNKHESEIIPHLQKGVGIKFTTIGHPTFHKPRVSFTEQLETTSHQNLKPYLQLAEELYEKHGIKILAAALSKIHSPKNEIFSILTGTPGLVTLKYTSETMLSTEKFKKILGFASEEAKHITFTRNKKVATFDVPLDVAQELESLGFEKIEDLPTDLEPPFLVANSRDTQFGLGLRGERPMYKNRGSDRNSRSYKDNGRNSGLYRDKNFGGFRRNQNSQTGRNSKKETKEFDKDFFSSLF